MPFIIICIYIAIIPIVLGFCKVAGIDERFMEGKERLENSYNNNNWKL